MVAEIQVIFEAEAETAVIVLPEPEHMPAYQINNRGFSLEAIFRRNIFFKSECGRKRKPELRSELTT
jgi:hypothetical protein